MTGRRSLASAGWMAGMSLVLWWAVRLPLGPSDAPELLDPAALVAWLPTADPAVVAVGIVRAIVVAVAAWMLLTSALATAAALLGMRAALVAVLRVSPAVVRRVVGSTAIFAVSATTLAASPAGATDPAERPPPEATLRLTDAATAELTATLRLLPPAPHRTEPGGGPTGPVAPETLVLLPDDGAAIVPPAGEPPSPTAPDVTPAATSGADDRPVTWTVRPGDSFWLIAEELLAVDGDAPSEAAFVDYWQRLIEANRSELADPDNPDLLLPGQVLAVP